MTSTRLTAAAPRPAAPTSPARHGLAALAGFYRTAFSVAIAVNLAYRGQVAIWVFTSIVQPIVLIVIWQSVAGPTGQVAGYTASQFVTYFAILMLVDHMTFIWLMWEFEYRIRSGTFATLLLRPIHPIHSDICDNLGYKLLGLVGVIPAMIILIIGFGGDVSTIGPLQVVGFCVALVGAYLLRFLIEWALALIAFWITKVSAFNSAYSYLILFLGGGFAPLAVMPGWIQTVAAVAPFQWMTAFPVEVAMGRRNGVEVLIGLAAQFGWIVVALIGLRLIWPRAVSRFSAVGT